VRPVNFIVKTIHKILIILILQLFCTQQSIHAQDTTIVVKTVKQKFENKDMTAQDTMSITKSGRHKFKPETLKATMMAVSFPGLGQIYNRKIWKIPVVYAGFGALIYSAGFNSRYYNQYMKAYQDFTDEIPQTNSYLKVINPEVKQSTYDKYVYPNSYNPATYSDYKTAMLRMVDSYKRYRDLSYIGIAGWYLLSILDANVDASLFNYDVSPNLDLTLVPMQMSLPGGFMGAGLSVDLKVNF
jgi:hypothetical protein